MKTKDLTLTTDLLHRLFGVLVPETDQSAFMRLITIGDASEWPEHEFNAFLRVARERGDVLGHGDKA